MNQGLVLNIQHFSIHDGPGIRTTVFLKGCPLSCWWCHNPESQSKEIQWVKRKYHYGDEQIVDKEQVGKLMTVDEVVKEIRKDYIFYDESDGGVTFSGGEPLMQSEFLLGLIQRSKDEGYHVALDTTGYANLSVLKTLDHLVDLYLFDLKLTNDSDHKKFTGVSLDPVLNSLHYLASQRMPITIRFPIIPGITDGKENVTSIMKLMKSHGLSDISLLPYHSIASEKYKRFGITNKMEGYREPHVSEMDALVHQFIAAGFNVRIGG